MVSLLEALRAQSSQNAARAQSSNRRWTPAPQTSAPVQPASQLAGARTQGAAPAGVARRSWAPTQQTTPVQPLSGLAGARTQAVVSVPTARRQASPMGLATMAPMVARGVSRMSGGRGVGEPEEESERMAALRNQSSQNAVRAGGGSSEGTQQAALSREERMEQARAQLAFDPYGPEGHPSPEELLEVRQEQSFRRRRERDQRNEERRAAQEERLVGAPTATTWPTPGAPQIDAEGIRELRGRGTPEPRETEEYQGPTMAGGFPVGNSRYRQEMNAYWANELTPEEYAELNPQQQAATQFNRGLLEAHAIGDDAVRNFVTDLGVDVRSEEDLNSYLNLSQLIGDSILGKLGGETGDANRRQSAESLRWARGNTAAAGDSVEFSRANAAATLAADLMNSNLSMFGQRGLGQEARSSMLTGFGDGVEDHTIREAYAYMVDREYAMTPQDVANGLAHLNHQFGTSVSTDDLWEYARARVDAVDTRRPTRVGQAENREGDYYPLMDLDPIQGFGEDGEPIPFLNEAGQPIVPLSSEEIRARYGL